MRIQRHIADRRFKRVDFSMGFRSLNGVVLVAAIACLTGCSGLGTDNFSGDALSGRPILPPEIPPSAQPESDAKPDAAINQLAEMVGATAKNTTDATTGDAPSSVSQEVKTPAFRFSAELPEEPNFSNDFPAAEPTGHATPTVAEFENGSTSSTESVVTLVASTQPVGAEIANEPIGTYEPTGTLDDLTKLVESASAEFKEFESVPPLPAQRQPLKPIVVANPEPEPAPVEDVKVAVGLPPLSVADLNELTQSVIETPSLASSQSVDLSELELESHLAAKPTPPAPQPPQKPLTAAEHLSETIRLIEETVSSASGSGEYHGAEPGVRLLEILRQKMERVSSSDWRLSATEHQYWQQQLQAVSVMFESDSNATSEGENQTRHQTATRAIEHLERAASHLRSMAGLKLYGGQLCSQIFGFGKFEELKSKQFQPGDRALIYVEIENQATQKLSGDSSSASENGSTWQTRLRASYVVRDTAKNIVHQETYPDIEDLARRHRRDFYVHLPVTIPELSPGDYQLSVSVEDLGDPDSTDAATLPAIDFSVAQLAN